MSIVKIKDKRSGVTYVYEQGKSVWDPVKKQARSRRVLIGKVDPVSGETVPTKGWGKRRVQGPGESDIKDWRAEIRSLRQEIDALRQECSTLRIHVAELLDGKPSGR